MSVRLRNRLLLAAVVLGVMTLVLYLRRERSQPRDLSARTTAATGPAGDDRDNAGGGRPEAQGPSPDGAREWFLELGGRPISLAGRVFVDGKPVANAVVVLADTLTTTGLLPERRAVTDGDGRFAFAGVPPIRGSYRLATVGPDRAPASVLVAGSISRDDIELGATACRTSIYGVVVDASGGSIAGARAFFDETPEAGVVSDAAGKFAICSPSWSRLRVEATGYGPWQRDFAARGAQRQDVVLMPDASLTGTVVSAERGEPAPWALVSVKRAGEPIHDVQADAAGRFDIDRLAPGAYTVEARTKRASSKIPVEAAVFASAKATVVVPIEARASVRGRIVAGGRRPVARAKVRLGFPATFEWSRRTTTDEQGVFRLDDVPIGNVLIEVTDFDVAPPRALRVPQAGLVDAEVVVAAKAELRVAVVDDHGPVSDATVSVHGMDAPVSLRTDAAGTATFRGLGEATFRVLAERESDFAVAEGVRTTRAAPTSTTLKLGVARQIAGRVVDEEGVAVDGARIRFSPASSTVAAGAAATSGPDGGFHGGPLQGPAAYRVTVTRSGSPLDLKGEAEAGVLLDVPAMGAPSPASLLLVVKAQDRALSGVVVDASGEPVADARVIVTAPARHASVLATTFTGQDGNFAFRALGAGPYAVKAIAASGSSAEVKPVSLPAASVRIALPPVGSIRGKVKGFTSTPAIMAWSVVGYDDDFHPAVIEAGSFTIAGLPRGRYHVAASTPDATAQTTVDLGTVDPVDVELVASGTRTIRGTTRDFLGGGPLPGMTCQVAPYVTDTRSPVVVPGSVFSDTEGAFEILSAPASDLYMWCTSDGRDDVRGGVARLPADLGERRATLWGLDLRGKPALDPDVLGVKLADDHPFSRTVSVVEKKSASERAGLAVGDIIDTVDGRSVVELGNGTLRWFLALALATQKSIAIVVNRGGAEVPLTYRLP